MANDDFRKLHYLASSFLSLLYDLIIYNLYIIFHCCITVFLHLTAQTPNNRTPPPPPPPQFFLKNFRSGGGNWTPPLANINVLLLF